MPIISEKKPDGLKVGGHQASCASMTAIMAALYFHALGPNDKVAVPTVSGTTVDRCGAQRGFRVDALERAWAS